MNITKLRIKLFAFLFVVLIILFLSICCTNNSDKDLISKKQLFQEKVEDSSIYQDIKSVIFGDTLIVNISIFNKSLEPKYIPINNWYVFGRPMTHYPVYGSNLIPKFNDMNYFNLIVYSNRKNNFPENKEYFVTIPLFTYPIIQKLNPGKTVTFKLKIVDSAISKEFSEKVYIKSNIKYASEKEHKKLIRFFGIDERKIIRLNNLFEFTFNLNETVIFYDFKNPNFGKPYQQFSESTKYYIDSIFPFSKDNSYFDYIFFNLIVQKCQYNGYDVKEYLDKSIHEVPKTNWSSIDSSNPLNFKQDYYWKYLSIFNYLLLQTYKYSINIVN